MHQRTKDTGALSHEDLAFLDELIGRIRRREADAMERDLRRSAEEARAVQERAGHTHTGEAGQRPASW